MFHRMAGSGAGGEAKLGQGSPCARIDAMGVITGVTLRPELNVAARATALDWLLEPFS